MTKAHLSLDNVKLKTDALIKLNLPIQIEVGLVNHLEIKIPWLTIGSNPVEVILDGLNLIVSPQKKSEWKILDIFDQKYLEDKLVNTMNDIKNQYSQEENQGYFEKLATKVVDNIQISITNFHVRFEDHFSGDQQYTFGMVMKSFQVQTTNSQWAQRYVDRTQNGQGMTNLYKLLKVEGFGIYLNPSDQTIIHQQTDVQENRIQLMDAIIEKQQDHLSYILRPSNIQSLNLLIVNLIIKLEYQTKPIKRANVSINLDKINLSFLKPQLKCMLKSMEIVSEYRKFQNYLLKTKKFKFLRPISGKVEKQNAKLWWRYAYLCIKKSNRAKNGSIKEFHIAKQQLCTYQDQFNELLIKFSTNCNEFRRLKKDDQVLLKHILYAVEFPIIKDWIRKIFEKQHQEEVKQKQTVSFTQWLLFGSQKKSDNDPEILNNEEIDELEKEISDQQLDLTTKMMHLNVALVIKETSVDIGLTNEDNMLLGINIFSKDMIVSFKSQSYHETSFEMQGSISDFGADLFSQNQHNGEVTIEDSVIMSNRKIFPQSLDEQLRIQIRKKPEDLSNIEYDINLITNPFVLIYNKEFVKRATLLSQLKINENYQSVAIDTFEDIREATSNQIYQIIYKKANRIRINVASPVIILPLTATSELTKPVWVMRLGDLQVLSAESQMNTSIVEYEKYEILIDSIRMQYYSSFGKWQKNLENLRNFRDKTIMKEMDELVFSVLEDCWMKFKINIKQKKAGMLMLSQEQKLEHDLKPKLYLQGSSSEVKINLTHSIYNKLVNLDQIFDLSKDIDIQKPYEDDQIQNKKQVLHDAKKSGQLQKRLDPAKIWEKYHCILSGNYLYFYKDQNQLMPISYFYLRGAEIQENQKDVGPEFNIQMKNRFGDCCVSFNNSNHQKEWTNLLRNRIYEIKQEEEELNDLGIEVDLKTNGLVQKRKKLINHQSQTFKFEFSIPSFKTLLVDEIKYFQDWILLHFKNMAIINTIYKTSSRLELRVEEISLIDLTVMVNSSLVSQNKFHSSIKNALDVQISSMSKNNPSYKNIDQSIDIVMENLNIKMQPTTFNEIIKFIMNTKPNLSYNQMSRDEFMLNQHLLQSIKSNISTGAENVMTFIKHQTENELISCKMIKETYMHVNVKFINLSVGMLHHHYQMEIYRMDTTQLQIKYIKKYDHFNFETDFRDIFIYDLTGYPYTLSPKLFSENPQNFKQTQRELIRIQDFNESDSVLHFGFESYQTNFCQLKRFGISSKINLSISSIYIEYFQEAIMRFYKYFFEQFLSALTETDPYLDYKGQYELIRDGKTIKGEAIKRMTQISQETEIMDMHIQIKNLQLKVPDRPDSPNYILFGIHELNVSQQLLHKAKRISVNPDQKLYVKSFKINCDGIVLEFGEKYKMTNDPFNIKVIFETLAESKQLENADPQIIEQASHIFINFDPIDLVLPQNVYTNILRCMDLNLNFQDMLDKEFYFIKYQDIEDYYKQLSNVVNMRIKLKFESLSLKLKHLDGSFLSEMMIIGMSMNMIKYMDFTNKMFIKINNFFISEFETRGKNNLKISPFNKEQSQKAFYQLNSTYFVIQPILSSEEAKDNTVQILLNAKNTTPSQILVNMITNQFGEKDIKVDISGLKITIKPHILLLIYYFFINSFPEYEEDSKDIPSYYNFDPEDAPKMDFSIELQDSLLCMQNKPGLKTICCQGKIFFELKRENIKRRKELLLHKELRKASKDVKDDEMDFEETLEQIESKYVYNMSVLVSDLCPFVCSLSQLQDNEDFTKIKKRQLFTPFKFSYITSYQLGMKQPGKYSKDKDPIIFGVNCTSDIKLERLKMKLSLQDMHLLYQIITFANENVSKEYLKKLERIDLYIKNQTQGQDLFMIKERFDRSQTIKKDFGIKVQDLEYQVDKRRSINEMFKEDSEDQDKFKDVFDAIQQQYEQTITQQFQRLRSTTLAFSNLAHKYTTTTQNTHQKQTFKSKLNQKTFYAKKQLQQSSEQYITVFSRSNIRDENELDLHQKQIQNIQPFFNSNQTVSKKKDQSRQTKELSQQLSHRLNANDYLHLSNNLQSEKKSIRSRSRLNTDNGEDDDDQFLDAKSELFYSVHGKDQEQAAESKYATPLNGVGIDIKEINKDIQLQIDNMEKSHDNVNVFQITLFYIGLNSENKGRVLEFNGKCIQKCFHLFINDYDNAFCPVLDLDIPNLFMKQEQQNESSLTEMNLHKMKALYFNAFLGDWEPFIESFEVEYLQNLVGQQQFMQIDFPKSININITENCLTSLISTYNSWMETPPYQYEDYQQRQRLLSSRIQIDEENYKSSSDSNPTSINKEDELSEDQASIKIEDIKEVFQAQKQKKGKADDRNMEKVTPFSILNLTNHKISVVKSELLFSQDYLQEFFETNRITNSVLHPFSESRTTNSKIYEVLPQQEVEYAIDYEKEASNLLNTQSRKRKNRFSKQGTIDSGKKNKKNNQQLVNLVFDNFYPIKDLDLNKIQSYRQILENFEDSRNGSVILEDKQSLLRYSTNSKSRSKFEIINYIDEIFFGVTLDKLRKILTIRTPYIIFNNTKFDYLVIIKDQMTGIIKEKYLLKSEQKHSISNEFYFQHEIQLQIKFNSDTSLKNQQSQDTSYSNSYKGGLMIIENVLKLEEGKGILLDHKNQLYTYVQKVKGEIAESFDIILLPPIVVKNALPQDLEMMGVYKENVTTRDQNDQVFKFQKGEEKQFHIFSYQGDKRDEINIQFRIPGFNWTQVQFKSKFQGEQIDKDIIIKDHEGSNLQLCIRQSIKKGGFTLTFYASTIIINHSLNKFKLFYDTINKQVVAGQEQRQDFIYANREDSLLACIGERYSNTIKIKTAGIRDQFSIISLQNSHLTAQIEAQIRQKKYEFVYETYLSLVVDNDYIYTKIVQISPKYVLVNNMKSAICIAQAGTENYSQEVLEPGERREWVWADANHIEEIVIKKQDATIENMFRDSFEQSSLVLIPEEDRYKKWKWSQPFSLNQLGLSTIEIKKIENRFNNLKARKIIKIVKKKIEASTYIIFEDEDKKYPYYRLENTSSEVSVWFVQKGLKFEEEGSKLTPKTTLPFAFLNPQGEHFISCIFVFNGRDPLEQGRTLSLREEQKQDYNFEKLDQKHHIEYTDLLTAQKKKVHISIYTDGCTKIIRFSDNPLTLERKEERERDVQKSIHSFIAQSRILKTTFQMNIREVLVSFITSIDQKIKGQQNKSRKEVAILTIQDVQIDQYQSQEWYKNKIVISSIQIDNQSMVKPLFPTILQPRLFRTNDQMNMIEIEVNMNTENPEITYIDEIDFKFSGMIIKCDDSFLGYALSFGYGVVELLKKNLTGTHPIFQNREVINHIENEYGLGDNDFKIQIERKSTGKFYNDPKFYGVVSIPQKQIKTLMDKAKDIKQQNPKDSQFEQIEEIYKSWLVKTIATKQRKIYLNICQLQNLDIELSFLARKSFQLGEKEDTLQLQSFMNWWGLALINIDEAPIQIQQYNEKQQFGMQEDFINNILEHYQGGLKRNFFNLISSTEILGNPRKLVTTIGNGVNDFIRLPLENKERGPLHVIKGGILGTGSLIKNSFEGTFGFIQSFSGQLSKGLLLLSLDKEYLSEREEQLLTEKPKNIVEGVGYGLQSALNSIYSGVTGVVTRPYKEAKRDGFKGALVGGASGAIGLVLKPFSGGLDLLSKSTEGIKNTLKIFEAKIFKDRRRLPRPMYGYNQQIKSYNDMDSYIVMRILFTVKDGVFMNDHYIETLKFQENERTLFLIISEEHVILLDARQKAVWWNISSQNISAIDKLENGLILRFRNKQNYKTQEVIEINSRPYLEKIYERLKQLEKP